MEDRIFISRVKRPPSAFAAIYRPLMAILTIVYGVMTYYNRWMIFFAVLCAAIFLRLLLSAGKHWYEYRLDASGFLVTAVYRGKKKKTLLNLAAGQIELVVKSQSELLRPYMKDGKRVLMRDLASGRRQEWEYVIVYREGKKTSMALLELEEGIRQGFALLFPEKTK